MSADPGLAVTFAALREGEAPGGGAGPAGRPRLHRGPALERLQQGDRALRRRGETRRRVLVSELLVAVVKLGVHRQCSRPPMSYMGEGWCGVSLPHGLAVDSYRFFFFMQIIAPSCQKRWGVGC